jgi:hypothetical protein
MLNLPSMKSQIISGLVSETVDQDSRDESGTQLQGSECILACVFINYYRTTVFPSGNKRQDEGLSAHSMG